MLADFNTIVSKKNKVKLFLLIILLILLTLIEIVSIGIVPAFISLMIDPVSIINKISTETANLNTIRRDRLKLVWVNNNKMIGKLEEINQNKRKKYLKLKKTIKAYN